MGAINIIFMQVFDIDFDLIQISVHKKDKPSGLVSEQS